MKSKTDLTRLAAEQLGIPMVDVKTSQPCFLTPRRTEMNTTEIQGTMRIMLWISLMRDVRTMRGKTVTLFTERGLTEAAAQLRFNDFKEMNRRMFDNADIACEWQPDVTRLV